MERPVAYSLFETPSFYYTHLKDTQNVHCTASQPKVSQVAAKTKSQIQANIYTLTELVFSNITELINPH